MLEIVLGVLSPAYELYVASTHMPVKHLPLRSSDLRERSPCRSGLWKHMH